MRIAFLTPHSLLNYGGGEKWTIWVSNKLVDLGHQVDVFALKYSPTGKYRIDRNSLQGLIKFRYQELDYEKGRFNPLRMKRVPTIEADIIYVTGGYYFFLMQALKIKAIKVYGFHDPALQKPENFLQKRIVRNVIPRFHLVHTLNGSQTELFDARVHICQIENTYLAPLPECKGKFAKFSILFFGQHQISKGIDIVNKLIATLPEDIDFFIAGNGPEKIFNHNKKNVKILGFVDESMLSDLICMVHAVFFPSRSEASSLVSVESLAHGTPLIYRNIPQNSRLHDIPLCLSANTDDEFLHLILQLQEMYKKDPQKYISICKSLPKFIESSDEYIQKFEKMLTSLFH